MLVRIIEDWDYPDLARQTPGRSMAWGGIRFTREDVEACDHVVVVNHAKRERRVVCSPDRVWNLVSEPPTAFRLTLHRGMSVYSRVYMQDATRRDARHIPSHPALPWWVGKSYDELRSEPPPEKPMKLSWITSNLDYLDGHARRMRFLERMRASGPAFDLFGRGFAEVPDKWTGIAPYRYAIAVENFSGPYYWSEKLTDCLLGWAMPFYHGCTHIADWLPAGAIVPIDVADPDTPRRIAEVIESDLWLERREAIAEARRRILEELQLFPFLHREIMAFLADRGDRLRPPRPIPIGTWPDRREWIRLTLQGVGAKALRAVGLLPGPESILRRWFPGGTWR